MRREALVAAVSAGALAGLGAGIVTSVGARVVMRLVALGLTDGIGQAPGFTFEGTAALAATIAVLGAPFGVLYDRAFSRAPVPTWARGIVFGALCVAVLGPILVLAEPEEFVSAGRVALFMPLFLIFGVALGVLIGPARRIAPALPIRARTVLAMAVALGCAVFALALVNLVKIAATSPIGRN